MPRGGGAGGGGRGMAGGGGGRGMSGGRGGSSAGRGGGMGSSGGRGGGMGGSGGMGRRSGGMSGPGGMGGMGGPAPRRRRSSGSGFGTGFLMGSLLSGGRRNRRVEDNGGPADGGGGGGCLGGMMFPLLIVIILLVVVIASCSVMNMGGSSGYDDYGVAYEGSDINREKLDASQCKESSEWIDDELGWLSKQSTVKNAMDSFYKDTGGQPYLIITDNIDGKGEDLTDEEVESYLTNVYDSLYSDEGHMILLFIEYEPSEYYRFVYTGTAADGVIDSSAKEYIMNLVDAYYTDTSLTDDEYFAKIFTTAGENLMQDFNESTHTRNIIIIIIVIGVILIIVLFLVRRASEARAKEAAHTKEILDTPIGNSSSDDELLHKYGEDTDGNDPGGDGPET